jgi:hypothetical protein
MCPTCGNESIELTFLYATLSVLFDGMPCTISGLNAYRCDDAHFFIVLSSRGSLEKSEANRKGPSIFL